MNKSLDENLPFSYKQVVIIPEDTPYSQPFWLEKSNNGNMFDIPERHQVEEAQSGPALSTKFHLKM